MSEPRDSKLCPKRDRCRRGESCLDTGVFYGEFLCFESKAVNVYEHKREELRRAYATKKLQNKLKGEGGMNQ